MNGEATARPWKARISEYGFSIEGDKKCLASCCFGNPNLLKDCTEDKANAELIVRAVNCHDELVVALDIARAALRGVQLGGELDRMQLDGILTQAQAALKAARGE